MIVNAFAVAQKSSGSGLGNLGDARMDDAREPLLKPVKISDLRPTQITVGIQEVQEKRRRWKEKHGKKTSEFLGQHMIPVILGPKNRHYVIDHHHLARALHEAGVKDILTTIVADLSSLDKDAFWVNMDNRSWMHPYDDAGKRRDHSDIPKSIDKLIDDPFRSLAGGLRRVGGYGKDTTPFSEFLWADFLRRRMKRKMVEDDYAAALEKALQLAKSSEAGYLPGWCGPADDE